MESRYAWCRSPAVWGVVGYHRLIVTKHLKVLVGMQMSGPQYGVPGAVSRGGTTPCRFPVALCRRRKHMKRSIVAVLCAVLVIAAVTLWIAEGYTPEGTVRRYLASLAKGDAETALSMVDPGVPSDQRIFLTNEVMASAASRLEIESIEASSSLIEIVGISRVTATLRLDGHRFTHVFTLDRKDREDSIMSTWTIREGLVVPLKVSGHHVPRFSVGGAVTDLDSSAPEGTEYLFFPGVYDLQPEGTGEYVDAQSARAVVEDGTQGSSYETTHVTLEGSLNSQLRGEVLRAAQDAVQACGTLGRNADQMCPSALRSSSLSVLNVTTLPSTLVSVSDSGAYTGEDAVITYQDPGSWLPDRHPHTLTLRPTMTVELSDAGVPVTDIDGKPVISVTLSIPSSSGDSPSS